MGYNPLRNWKHDSGPKRIQSGPAHESYRVVSSGIIDTGPDLGVLTAGPPNASGVYEIAPFYILCEDGSFLLAENGDFLIKSTR